jgi:hypothetical protein
VFFFEELEREVNATGVEGCTSITEFIEAAAMREVRRLQRKYNAGKKWPGVPAGGLRLGRRTREKIRQQNAERT